MTSTLIRPRAPARPLLLRVGCAVLLVWLTLGERLAISFSGGGRGVVTPLAPLVVVSGLSAWATMRPGVPRLISRSTWWITAGPLLLALILLPILGGFRPDYGLHTIAFAQLALVPMGVFLIGRALGGGVREAFLGVGFWAIVVHGLYAAGQTTARLGAMPDGLWSWATAWDSQSQLRFASEYLVSQRSTGLFLNPNQFGQWSVLAMVFSATYLTGWRRTVGVMLGLFGLYGSQSRTAILAFVLVVAVASLGSQRFRKYVALPVGLTGLLVFVMMITGSATRILESNAVARLRSGLSAVFNEGYDRNLSSRLEIWDSVGQVSDEYPLGTWGPPQVAFGESIDSQYVSFYLQGGWLLVGAYLLLLVAPFTLWRLGVRGTGPLWAMSAVVAICSITAVAYENLMGVGLIWLAAAVTLREHSAGPDATRASPRGTLPVAAAGRCDDPA